MNDERLDGGAVVGDAWWREVESRYVAAMQMSETLPDPALPPRRFAAPTDEAGSSPPSGGF